MSRPPRFVFVIVAVAVISLVVIGGIAVQLRIAADQEAKRDCERAIASRNDSRAMWLYLIDTAKADPKVVGAFAVKLDELLPPLRCEGGNWVPAR